MLKGEPNRVKQVARAKAKLRSDVSFKGISITHTLMGAVVSLMVVLVRPPFPPLPIPPIIKEFECPSSGRRLFCFHLVALVIFPPHMVLVLHAGILSCYHFSFSLLICSYII